MSWDSVSGGRELEQTLRGESERLRQELERAETVPERAERELERVETVDYHLNCQL